MLPVTRYTPADYPFTRYPVYFLPVYPCTLLPFTHLLCALLPLFVTLYPIYPLPVYLSTLLLFYPLPHVPHSPFKKKLFTLLPRVPF